MFDASNTPAPPPAESADPSACVTADQPTCVWCGRVIRIYCRGCCRSCFRKIVETGQIMPPRLQSGPRVAPPRVRLAEWLACWTPDALATLHDVLRALDACGAGREEVS